MRTTINKIGVENEGRVINEHGERITHIHLGKKGSIRIIDALRTIPYIQNSSSMSIVPELDIEQFELIIAPCKTLDELIDKTGSSIYEIEKYLKRQGLSLDKEVGTIQDPFHTPRLSSEIYSDLLTPDTIQRYSTIGERLQSHGVRNDTNILGLHINISERDSKNALSKFINLNQKIKKILANDEITKLNFNHERYMSYKRLCNKLGLQHIPSTNYDEIIDNNGNIKDGYAITRFKKFPDGSHGSELRFPKAITSSTEVEKHIKDALELYLPPN